MASSKTLISKLPINPGAITKAISSSTKDAQQKISVRLIVGNGSASQLRVLIRQALLPSTEALSVNVISSIDALKHGAHKGDICTIYLGHDAGEIAQILVSELKSGQETLLVADDAQALLDVEQTWNNLIDYSDVILFDESHVQAVLNDLAGWLVRKFPKQRETLASSWQFMRKPLTANAITTTAMQNFAIAAIPFLPGADMPLITGNQLRMTLTLARCYGLELTNARLKEIAAVLVVALGSRGLARKLVGAMPFAKWLARGIVGSASTLALGFILQSYYAIQANVSSDKVDSADA